MKKLLCIAMLAALSACSTPKQAVVDTTPEHQTVVFAAKGTVNGYVLPDFTFTQSVYTQKDRRVIAMDGQYDSWMARKVFGELKDTVIFRMDKDLRWILLRQKDQKQYLECPLEGCKFSVLAQFDKKQDSNNEDQFDYNPDAETECRLDLAKNSFSVKATGQKRQIAGYLTREYKGTWLIEYKDAKGRKDKNTLNIVFWNTDPTNAMTEAWAIDGAATKTYLAKVKHGNNPLAKYLPDSIFMALSAFSGDTSKKDQKWQNTITRELAKAQGYPMSIKTEWYLDRNACPEAKPAEKALDWSNPLAAMKESASKYAGKQAQKMFMPNPKEPIFRYIYDVTSVDIKPVHDSVFEVPAGYKLVTRE
jgi:hypothetical protein